MQKIIPESLNEHVLPFNWDVKKVWSLDADVIEVPMSTFHYMLDLPFWSSKSNVGMLFDLTPRQAINDLEQYPHQRDRINNADISYAVDFIKRGDQFLILDGLHRLVNLFMNGEKTVRIRCHSVDIEDLIRVSK